MCMFDAPSVPTPPAPQVPQSAQMAAPPGGSPESADARKRMAQSGGAGAASTLLTGPSGVDNSMVSLGKTTLLGQ